MSVDTSVIVTTYNQPDYLNLVLASLVMQSDRHFEVIVADDGSQVDNRAIIDRYVSEFGLIISHVWHEDCGFRKTVILNKAIAQSKGTKIIFADGDCILHRHFIREHKRCLVHGVYCIGRTPRLSRKISAKVSEAGILKGSCQRLTPAMLLDSVFGSTRKIEFGCYLGSGPFFSLAARLKKNTTLWGGNCSVLRKDLLAVNGWNEDFIGWGQEDSELGERLQNLGLKPRQVVYRAINFHLWHPKSDQMAGKHERCAMKLEIKKQGIVSCFKGLNQHLPVTIEE
ncbi:glycosyltransferase [Desulfocurvibacter africanus]|uniref:glycosyltransferase n=1 Tax=Desulfocurvibacter africanus TaxID=873 RepID=UPI002FDA9673